jgi:hypothetical protein
VIAIVTTGPDQEPGQFQTQTHAPQHPSQSRSMIGPSRQSRQIIAFQATSGVDREAIERVLADNGLTLIEGPSDGGVYRVSVPPNVNLESAANALIGSPKILFALPD